MLSSVPDKLERGRFREGAYGSDESYGFYDAFEIQGPCGERLRIISSAWDETGWEHVSVSTRRRPPNWQEMCFVKDLFWDEEDGTVRCLACGRYASHNAEKVLIRHPNGMPMKIIAPASRMFDNLR